MSNLPVFSIFNDSLPYGILADVKLITIIRSEGDDFAANIAEPF